MDPGPGLAGDAVASLLTTLEWDVARLQRALLTDRTGPAPEQAARELGTTVQLLKQFVGRRSSP